MGERLKGHKGGQFQPLSLFLCSAGVERGAMCVLGKRFATVLCLHPSNSVLYQAHSSSNELIHSSSQPAVL